MFIDPMLLATAPGPFSDSNFIFEPKIDGHRLIYSQKNGVVCLYTSHNNDCTRQYPEMANVLFPHDIVLDGEIACVDPIRKTSISKKATPHIFRHTHIGMMAESDVDLKTVMKRVGHDDPKSNLASIYPCH